MKKITLVVLISISTTILSAKDDIGDYSVKEAMAVPKIAKAIGDGISFYFGNTEHPEVVTNFGEFKTNKKTNAFGKSDKEACQWVFASAMKQLKQRAVKEGG